MLRPRRRVDGADLLRQPPHWPQAPGCNNGPQPEGQQAAQGQQDQQLIAVGGQHLLALGQQAAGDELQAIRAIALGAPSQAVRRRPADAAPLHTGHRRQRGRRQANRVDLNQHAAASVEHPEQAVAVAQHVGVELRPALERRNAAGVAEQVAHALQATAQGLVVAPRQLGIKCAQGQQANTAEQQQADDGETQRQTQAQPARPHGVASSV
jgi:hypothetical protein